MVVGKLAVSAPLPLIEANRLPAVKFEIGGVESNKATAEDIGWEGGAVVFFKRDQAILIDPGLLGNRGQGQALAYPGRL